MKFFKSKNTVDDILSNMKNTVDELEVLAVEKDMEQDAERAAAREAHERADAAVQERNRALRVSEKIAALFN